MNDLASASPARLDDSANLGSNQGWVTVSVPPKSSPVAQYIKIARRWKWVIIASIAVGIAAALVVTLLMTRQYSANVTIEIAREEARIVNVQGVEPEQSGRADDEFYQTQYGLLASHSLAERVGRELQLADNRAFLNINGIGDAQGLFTDERPLDNSAAAREGRLRAVGGALLKNLTVTPTRLSRLVSIVYTSPDPQLSARIANAWGRLFIQTNIERRFEATAYARSFLETRLAETRQRLDRSERELVAYAADQRIISINTPSAGGAASERPIIADDLVAYNTALAAATTDRIAAESAMNQGSRGAGTTSTSLNNAALNGIRQQRSTVAAEYSRLQAQFGPEYPQVIALASQLQQIDRTIAMEEGRVTSSLSNAYRQALDRERQLSARVDTLKNGLLDLRRRSIQYNILQRDISTSQAQYDGLLQRYKDISVAGAASTNNVSIVDPAAVPSAPSSPRPLINLLLGMLAGGAIGAGLALALDQIDEKITDPIEMERALGIPSLGVVPKFDTSEGALAELDNRRSALTEAYLTVKTNLQFATPSGVPRSLVVTSTRAGEGKSTTLLALAVVLARQGLKVVIIDADMRSPSLHHMFGVENEVGLSSLLSGNARWQDAVRDSGLAGIKIIAAGPHPPNAADLLSGLALEALLRGLVTEFDHVLIDAPPLLGLADAPLIASKVEGSVFVVEAYGVESRSAKIAVDRLQSSGSRVVGAVLTKFESRKAAYGYGYDYGYGYGETKKTT